MIVLNHVYIDLVLQMDDSLFLQLKVPTMINETLRSGLFQLNEFNNIKCVISET